ncbi:MAG: hypothetical protein V3T74_09250 [Gemmatimonadales bacterium]|jgi:hypothetical protein
MMNAKRNVGIVMLSLGVAYMVVIGWLASWSFAATFRSQTLAEVNETVWTLSGPLFWSWVFSVPLGAVISGVGLLLFVGAKRSHIWIFGVGMLVTLSMIALLRGVPHSPPIYGIVGGLILGFFLLILWFWARKRPTLQGSAGTAADLQLAGYVFLMMGMWQACGMAGQPFYQALSSGDPMSPLSLILYLGLGWLFLFLSHYVESRSRLDTPTASP